jgi:hypothetical protein
MRSVFTNNDSIRPNTDFIAMLVYGLGYHYRCIIISAMCRFVLPNDGQEIVNTSVFKAGLRPLIPYKNTPLI